MIKRYLGRKFDEIRNVVIEVNVNKFAEGSCYIKMGDTEVLCTATVEERIPAWLKYNYPRSGWVTAEYGMLPRATGRRNEREAVLGKQAGRTQEVQRLIGRSLRSAVNLQKLGERQIKIDCDVIQADGGTRCASITGAWVALYFACQKLFNMGKLEQVPIISNVVAISCGIYNGHIILDLDYNEDNEASADANFVITDKGQLVEVQVSGEQATFSPLELMNMLDLAQSSIPRLIKLQNEAIILKK